MACADVASSLLCLAGFVCWFFSVQQHLVDQCLQASAGLVHQVVMVCLFLDSNTTPQMGALMYHHLGHSFLDAGLPHRVHSGKRSFAISDRTP